MSIHTLMFGWEYPPVHLGGLGVACHGLVNGLIKNNVRVTLALPHPNSDDNGADVVFPTEKLYAELEETIRIGSLLQPYEGNAEYIQRIQQRLQQIRHNPKALNEIYGNNLFEAIHDFTEMSAEMTKHVEADVVHCHDWMTYGAGMRAAAYHNKPLVAHIHATELDRTHFSPNEWIYQREKDGFNAATKIIAVSNYTKNILVQHYGISGDKIDVVHNGSTDVYCPKTLQLSSEIREQTAPMILFLGRLALQKGAWQFLDMAAQIHKIRPDVQFVIAGDGHMMSELVDRAIELGLEHNVVFAGKVNNAEARRLYSAANCFVMPSLSEPFGLVGLEAIAHGTPVILSRQSGVSEVVGHCFKVDFWDTGMMADCALTILREEALASQLTSEAPHVLKNLTWENQAQHVRSVYNNAIQF